MADDDERMHRALCFIRDDYGAIEERLPEWLEVLRSMGASECFHKHGTFYQHLLEVYRMLVLWGAPLDVARCGLFHSAYSNSYVNLAIFKPGVDRSRVRALIGSTAEELVHLFCVVPRHTLVHDMLLFKFTDEQLLNRKDFLLPNGYLKVKNIRTGEDMELPRKLVAVFVLLTMADFADQLYNWQDKLFDNDDGKLEFQGNSYAALWPGDVKPGLWMSSISRMGILLKALIQEDEQDENANRPAYLEELNLQVPAVFGNCSRVLAPEDQILARDIYLDAVSSKVETTDVDCIASKLHQAIKLNPWVAEPHLVLSQLYCITASFELAKQEAEKGLNLLLQWGTVWDKRISWEAWVAWARVLKMNATNKTWPKTSWGMINLGLVS